METLAPHDHLLPQWAKSSSTWPALLAVLLKRPELQGMRLPAWGEGFMHWAALGELSAILNLSAQGWPVSDLDTQARSPLDWSVEKIYFLREDLADAPVPGTDAERMLTAQMLKAEECALALMDRGARSGLGTGPRAKREYGLLDLALRAGRPALVEALVRSEAGGSAAGGKLHARTSWLAGRWDGGGAAKSAWLALEKGQPLDDKELGALSRRALEAYGLGQLSVERLKILESASGIFAKTDALVDWAQELLPYEGAAELQYRLEEALAELL